MNENEQTIEHSPTPQTTSSLHADIAALASESASIHAFYSQALERIATSYNCPYAAVYTRVCSEVVERQYHSGPTDPNFWKPAVQDFLTSVITTAQPRARVLSAKNSTLQLGLIAVPLFDHDGMAVGGLSLVARMAENEIRNHVVMLESLAALISHLNLPCLSRSDDNTGRSAAPPSKALAKAATCDSPEELAFSITNSLRNNLGCQHVVLGLVQGKRVSMLAISGQDDLRPQSPGLIQIQQAMEECLDFGEPIVCQDATIHDSGDNEPSHRLHLQWHNQSQRASVASIPLVLDGRCVAVLSLQKKPDTEFTTDLIKQIRDTVEPFAPALLLLMRARRSLVRHTADALFSGIRGLLQSKQYGIKISTILLVALAGWLVLGRMDYEIVVPCVIKPAQLRHIAVPYDAVLVSAEVTAGDPVRQGDILCRLDQRELELKRAERRAELAVAEQAMQRAMASKTPVDAKLAEMEAQLARAQLASIDDRIEQAVIRSPFDGIVVEGDLRTQIGSVLPQGTPLYRIAPRRGWKIEIQIPENAGADIQSGLSGRFASLARPEASHDFQLTRILPSAVVRDKQVSLVAEANLDVDESWLRPGMEGVAKIHVARRPVWWVLFHSVLDYLRLHLWL